VVVEFAAAVLVVAGIAAALFVVAGFVAAEQLHIEIVVAAAGPAEQTAEVHVEVYSAGCLAVGAKEEVLEPCEVHFAGS